MNYLEVHPATQAWWGRREKCESCRHLTRRLHARDEVQHEAMRCRAALKSPRASRPSLGIYCIDARDEDGPCGPEARLYEPKE